MTSHYDPRSEPAPDSVRPPVNWRLRNCIAAIVANQHREYFDSDVPTVRVDREQAQEMFDTILGALGGEQNTQRLGLNSLSQKQVDDLISHAGESAEEELAELKLAIYYYFQQPEMRFSASQVLHQVSDAEAARRRRQGINS